MPSRAERSHRKLSRNRAQSRSQVVGCGDTLAVGSMSVATRLRVPSDNSCLFSAVAALCETTAEARVASAATQRELREVAARAVLDDPDAATRALLLGKPVDEYARQTGAAFLPYARRRQSIGLLDVGRVDSIRVELGWRERDPHSRHALQLQVKNTASRLLSLSFGCRGRGAARSRRHARHRRENAQAVRRERVFAASHKLGETLDERFAFSSRKT